MLLGVKVCWHATVDFALWRTHTTAKRHALQFSIKCIAPLVVRTNQFFFIAMTFPTEGHAAMRANVLNHMYLTILATRHDDRAFAHDRSLEIAQIRNLGLKPHIVPMRFVKKPLELFLVEFATCIYGKRNTTGTLSFPMNSLFLHEVSSISQVNIFRTISFKTDHDQFKVFSKSNYQYNDYLIFK